MSWYNFTKLLIETYFPESDIAKLEIEFLKRMQGNDSVLVYTTKFIAKSRFAKYQVATKERKVAQYVEGLRDDTKRLVKLPTPETVLQAVEGLRDDIKSSLEVVEILGLKTLADSKHMTVSDVIGGCTITIARMKLPLRLIPFQL
ncbi:zinc finger, CCHC-type, retrotransposon gag domain protein [Tanacetum coccineum]